MRFIDKLGWAIMLFQSMMLVIYSGEPSDLAFIGMIFPIPLFIIVMLVYEKWSGGN